MRKIVAACRLGVDIMEIYSPERINQICVKFGLLPGSSLDLTTGWDLSRRDDQEAAWQKMVDDEPGVLIGSPPCTRFSMLQNINFKRYEGDEDWNEKFKKELAKAKAHASFCCRMYRYQVAHGRCFLHEHPWSASSWRLWDINQVMKLPGVQVVRSDLCRFGMQTMDDYGELQAARKRTGFMTNSVCIANELRGDCDIDHVHQPLIAGRAAACAVYPPMLCKAICKGYTKQKVMDTSTATPSRPVDRNLLSSIIEGKCGARPCGEYPMHWTDFVHDLDGGEGERCIWVQASRRTAGIA